MIAMLALLPLFLTTIVSAAEGQSFESGKFLYSHKRTVDFSKFDEGNQSMHSFLHSKGLNASDWTKEDQPSKRGYSRDNVKIVDGVLQLKVDPVDQENTVYGAEVSTMHGNIQYASVITTAKSSNVEGVCEGFFYYLDDQHEIDIEILTSYKTKGYGEGDAAVHPGIQLTNQALTAGEKGTTKPVPTPAIADGKFHDYRIDWTPGRTEFFIDDKQVASFTENVSDKPGAWVWNAWSNGDPAWSAGPPKSVSTTEISKIVMFFNTTDVATPPA